jgi:hypothetical protein
VDPNATKTEPAKTEQKIDAAPGVPADLTARLAALENENKSLRDESAAKRVKARDATLAAEKLAEEQGQHKALAESLKQRIGELEPLENDAKAWRAHLERETARLAKVREGLPAHWQAAIDASPTVDGKQAILSAYEAERASSAPQGKQPAKAPAPGNPPGSASTDWAQLASDATALREAKQRDPTGWDGFVQKATGAGARVLTSFERRQAAQAAKK